MQSPTAVPRIPASASGVSTQRSAPNRSCSPAVARKTPPRRPTSSPMTRTEGSRSSSTCSASFTASTRNRSATEDPLQLCEILGEHRGRIGVRVLEYEPEVRLRLRFRFTYSGLHQLSRFASHLLRLRLRQKSQADQ